MDAPSFVLESPSFRHKNRSAAPSRSPPKPPSELRLRMAPVNAPTQDKPSPTARKRRNKPRRSPPREPPPPPPPTTPPAYSSPVILAATTTAVAMSGPLLHEPNPASTAACVAPLPDAGPSGQYHKCYIKDEPSVVSEESIPEITDHKPPSSESSPIVARYILQDVPTGLQDQRHHDILSHNDQDSSSDSDDTANVIKVTPDSALCERQAHKPIVMARHALQQISDGNLAHSHAFPPLSSSVPAPPSLLHELTRIPEDDVEPLEIGPTRPVPPPQTEAPQISPLPPLRRRHPGVLKMTVSNPELISDGRRSRSVSFLNTNAGEERGCFSADYLGAKSIDRYLGCVDIAAKELVDLRSSVEVVAYVSSEKVRLAPPKNEVLLFKSFSMKEIFLVQKCNKNKRIFGIIIWKPKSIPVCHVLRCSDNLMADSFYDSVWNQSQRVDDVTSMKPTHTESSPRIQSATIASSGDSDRSDSSKDELATSSDILHNFSATYVGSAIAGKLHSIDEIIRKVLTDNKPSKAVDVCVMLSLSQLKLGEKVPAGSPEVVHVVHESSRIRAIGVYSHDKRFIGYIIKEEGKPLAGHVLRCNSAGLMVSLMSFLRQSCQFNSHQRGGSFYEELSTDDSEDFEDVSNAPVPKSPGFIKRLRSLTMSHHQTASAHVSTVSQPSFKSHTPICKPSSPVSPGSQLRGRDASVRSPSILSVTDFTEEDFAVFAVTYVGSAALERPLTRQSLVDALRVFEEEGVAAGKAAIAKNVIHMQISSLGITLTDKKHRLFVNRNYPRKQLEGYCINPSDSKYFVFASRRPGFPSSMKVHVFKKCVESTQRIVDSIRFWLEIEPTVV